MISPRQHAARNGNDTPARPRDPVPTFLALC